MDENAQGRADGGWVRGEQREKGDRRRKRRTRGVAPQGEDINNPWSLKYS